MSSPGQHQSKKQSRAWSTVKLGGRRVAERVRIMFQGRGLGFRRLAESHAGSVGGDTVVAIALAGTLFFSVPSADARSNVALYLVITLAPFAVIGPFLGRFFERFPAAYRGGLIFSSLIRAILVIVMAIWIDSFLLFPLAFGLLVLGRFHGIAKSSVLPVVLDGPSELIAGNANLARAGVVASAAAAAVGGLAQWLVGSWLTLVVAALIYLWSAATARNLPTLVLESENGPEESVSSFPPRSVRLARFATAAVRFLNGFLLLLVAFAFKEVDAAAAEFSALFAAAGLGYFIAAFITPVLDRYMSEEPMVVAGLAVEAGAAFIAGQIFGLPAASALALAAGLAWGTAKFGFDGLLQANLPIRARGRAFTNSETFFQIAWVVGALIPVVIEPPIEIGLAIAGIVALIIQVIYVSAVIVPVAHEARVVEQQQPEPSSRDVLDLL
ncbi:MAG: hypothetical protein HKN91_05830 [Acidimicrobiia bacterium]|nr:hypothetical protein [Acidimicrobiia bacterium]